MKKLLITLIIGLSLAGISNATLWEYYNGNLPSISDRASLALQCGISGYRGTADQNIKLESCLRNNGDMTVELGAALASSDLTQIVADFKTSLAVKLSVGGTSLTLQGTTDDDSVILASGKYSFTIDGSSAQKEYVICDLNPTTKVCSNVVNISRQGVRTTGAVREHRVGASITITDYTDIKYHNDILEGQTGIASTSPLFYIGLPTLTSSTQIATKGYVDSRNGYYEAPVANFAALPTGVNSGEMRVTLDDGKVYTWSGSAWILAGAGGGAGIVYRDDIVVTSTAQMTYKLSSGSWPAKNYLTVYRNGQLLAEGAGNDYTAPTTGNTITLLSAPVVSEVITLRVESIDFYNSSWTEVNDDLLPDIDATHDVGTTSLRFRDLNISRNAVVGGTLNTTGAATVGSLTIGSTSTANLISGGNIGGYSYYPEFFYSTSTQNLGTGLIYATATHSFGYAPHTITINGWQSDGNSGDTVCNFVGLATYDGSNITQKSQTVMLPYSNFQIGNYYSTTTALSTCNLNSNSNGYLRLYSLSTSTVVFQIKNDAVSDWFGFTAIIK